MLSSEMIKGIEDFVHIKPRSMQEIATHINKNWRTADRYVQEIRDNFGTIEFRIFRGGTRGALKIVYSASMDKISNSVFQESLEKEILNEKKKEYFSAMDLFQHIGGDKKKATMEVAGSEQETNLGELIKYIQNTKKQLFVFSGNLSLINLNGVFEILEGLVKKNVSIKVLCRVDLGGKENIEKLLSLNYRYGKELVEIHHREQPVRAFISDGKSFRIKELKEPTGKQNELDENLYIFYTISDKEWSEWLCKIFWKMFNSSIDANKRLKEFDKYFS